MGDYVMSASHRETGRSGYVGLSDWHVDRTFYMQIKIKAGRFD
jgi:hypothetical protein